MPTSSTEPSRAPTPRTPGKAAALAVAIAADAVQLAVFPLFGEGFASPFDDVLDVVVAGVLIKLLGFHWALMPALGAELVPGLDLAPTWTATVLLLTNTGWKKWAAVALAIALGGVAVAFWLWRR